MGQEHYQTVDHLKKEPQVGRGLFAVRLLILHLKFQFSKSIKSSTFHIFLNLTYPFRKNISCTKCPKITQKFTQNRQTVVNKISREIQRCLKRDRDIGRKAVISDIKSTCTFTPSLSGYSPGCQMSFPRLRDFGKEVQFPEVDVKFRAVSMRPNIRVEIRGIPQTNGTVFSGWLD